MTNKTYKQLVVDAALEGMKEGGFSDEIAQLYAVLLERVYDCGYNDARREYEELLMKSNPFI